MNAGRIIIRGLELPTYIGVPEEERATLQVLTVDMEIEPWLGFDQMEDDVSQTIDYAALTLRLRQTALSHPRKLIETLAHDLTQVALGEFSARSATVEIKKKILPGVDHVAVRWVRTMN
jgi:FolB domain-containing protein